MTRCPLSATLLGLLLTCGCRHAPPCNPSCDTTASNVVLPAESAAPVLHTANKPSSSDGVGVLQGQQAPVLASAAPAPNERTAGPRFAHDPDYHWLMGTISYSRPQDAWVLRYAPFEEDDRYGGVVTLTDCERLTGLTNGQAVRVEGHLIDPGSRQLRPAFHVQALAPAGS